MNRKKVVIKFGGNALTETSGKHFCKILAKLPEIGFHPIVIHGGGPQITSILDLLNIDSKFINGLRYTDSKTIKIAEMVLSGYIGKMLVGFLNDEGVLAASISGKDSNTLVAKKIAKDNCGNNIDLGYVGDVLKVSPKLLNILINNDFIPIVAPIGYGKDGYTYNINADSAASAIAKKLAVDNFIIMTNTRGLLNKNKHIVDRISIDNIKELINDGTIKDGMIPKVLSAIDTLSSVGQVNIIDGRKPNNLIKILSGENIGTTITI